MNANIFSIPGIYWICEHCDSQYEKQSQNVTPEQREDTQPKQQVPEQVDRTKTKVPEQLNIQPEKKQTQEIYGVPVKEKLENQLLVLASQTMSM